MDVLLEKAICISQERLHRLIKGSIEDDTGLVNGLVSYKGVLIKVYLTDHRLLKKVLSNPKANATVMRCGSEYSIFVNKKGNSRIKFIVKSFSRRFLVLHEYAHILHGDVFEDKDELEKVSILNFTPKSLKQYWKLPEKFANGYAAKRLQVEMAVNQCCDISKAICRLKKRYGWIFPCSKRYLSHYPYLRDEPRTWVQSLKNESQGFSYG